MYCIHCGKQLDDSATFCCYCGTRLKNDAPPPQYGNYAQGQNNYPQNNGYAQNNIQNDYPQNDFGQNHQYINYGNNPQQYNQPPQYNRPYADTSNPIAIVGFVFAFLIAIVGLICSIIGYNKAKNENAQYGDLAYAGIIISIVSMVLAFVISMIWLIVFFAEAPYFL